MKKSYKICMSLLAVIVVGILLSIPLVFLMDSSANASPKGSDKANVSGTYVDDAGDDYIFVLLQDDEVARAAAPITKADNHVLVYLLSIATLLILSILCYYSWYSMVKKNIKNFSYLIPKSELDSLVPAKAFVHPRSLSQAEQEILYRAANRYV